MWSFWGMSLNKIIIKLQEKGEIFLEQVKICMFNIAKNGDAIFVISS